MTYWQSKSLIYLPQQAQQLADSSLLTYHMCKMIVYCIQGIMKRLEAMEDLETLSCVAPQLRQDIGRLKRLALQNKGLKIYSGMPNKL